MISHWALMTLIFSCNIPSQFLDMWCSFEWQSTFHLELSYLGVAFWTNNVYLKHYFLEKNISDCLPLSKYCQTIFCWVLAKSPKNEVLIIGYVIWCYSPSGSTDFFILMECFDSQLFELKTESLFPFKMLRIKKFKTHSLDLPIR